MHAISVYMMMPQISDFRMCGNATENIVLCVVSTLTYVQFGALILSIVHMLMDPCYQILALITVPLQCMLSQSRRLQETIADYL